MFEYHFTDRAGRRRTGASWRREALRLSCPWSLDLEYLDLIEEFKLSLQLAADGRLSDKSRDFAYHVNMSDPAPPPPRDLLDRVIRESLKNPANLCTFLQKAVPQFAPRLECERARLLDREFPVDDWRRREADLPFEIPFRLGKEERLALVCLLLEHQSDPDALLPLRLLYFAVTYWDRQWRAWHAEPPPRAPLTLNPVLPLVLYTGNTPWGDARNLTDLLGEPEELHVFAPTWQPLFWNLADHSPETLMESGEEWLQTLAVIRAQDAAAPTFEAIYADVQRRLQGLSVQDPVRWYDLMRIPVTWAWWRRPEEEREALRAATLKRQSLAGGQTGEEDMGRSIGQAIFEEGKAEGEARGEARGQLLAARSHLRRLLTQRFHGLPDDVVERIENTADLERLEACIDQVLDMKLLSELKL